MEIHQLRYAVAIAETESFTRAAARVHVTQPSLSQQIINLENELGQKLFHRLGRRAVPTDAGMTFLVRARRILLEIDDVTKELSDSPDRDQRISIGGIPTVVSYLFPQLIGQCQSAFPHLAIHTRENFRSPLVQAVLEGDLDLALVSLPVKEPRLSIEPLFTEPLLLVVGRTHPLAEAPVVTATDLAEQSFVLLGESSSVALQIQRFCGDHDFAPRIGHRCGQIATVKALVALGLGISILPQVCQAREDQASLVYKRLSGREPERAVAVIRHVQRYQSRGVEQFLRILRQRFEPQTPAEPSS